MAERQAQYLDKAEKDTLVKQAEGRGHRVTRDNHYYKDVVVPEPIIDKKPGRQPG